MSRLLIMNTVVDTITASPGDTTTGTVPYIDEDKINSSESTTVAVNMVATDFKLCIGVNDHLKNEPTTTNNAAAPNTSAVPQTAGSSEPTQNPIHDPVFVKKCVDVADENDLSDIVLAVSIVGNDGRKNLEGVGVVEVFSFGVDPSVLTPAVGSKDNKVGAVMEAHVPKGAIHAATAAATMEFSALDVITFSAAVSKECLVVIRDPNRTVWAKIWATCKIVNNFMNKEGFFYMDMVICVAFSIYTATITTPMKAFEFYRYGPLAVNLVFLWYFSYCRYLNGKDVITLRRSIQLISHSFQISMVGLLVLCKEHNDHVTDDHVHKEQLYHVDFHCTGTFLASNALRIIWHVIVLLKSILDEYFGSFLITRGVAVDFITIVASPVLIMIALFTDISAAGMRQKLIITLGVNYEVNNITAKTEFYQSLDNSSHRLTLEAVAFFIFVESTGYWYAWWNYERDLSGNFDDIIINGPCSVRVNEAFMIALFGMVVMFSAGWCLSCEFFLCQQIKLCSFFFFLTVNIGTRICLCFYLDTVCHHHYRNDDVQLVTTQHWYLVFLLMTIVSGIAWLLFMWDNRGGLRRRHMWIVTDYFKFVCFVLIYSPLVPMYLYFVVPVAASAGPVIVHVSRQISTGISLKSFPTEPHPAEDSLPPSNSPIMALSAASPIQSTPVVADASKIYIQDDTNLYRLVLSWVLGLLIMPLGLITEVGLQDIQSFLKITSAQKSTPYDAFQDAFENRKFFVFYFFLFMTMMEVILIENTHMAAAACSTIDIGRLKNVIFGGYAVISMGSVLLLEYIVWKRVKCCGAFWFLWANVAVRALALHALSSNQLCEIDDDYSEVEMRPEYVRLMAGFILSAIFTVTFCYDNAAGIWKRHVWLLMDYFRLLWFLLVIFPMSTLYSHFLLADPVTLPPKSTTSSLCEPGGDHI
jgi:hypothetical protein